jgi:hypothetical protein
MFRGERHTMGEHLIDLMPIVVCETAPVRDASGNIIDLEWIEANRLMNESILPGGGSIVGMRVFEFDPAYRESEMVRAVLDVITTGEPRTLKQSIVLSDLYGFDDQALARHVLRIVQEFAAHEVAECFLLDGKRVFDPHREEGS